VIKLHEYQKRAIKFCYEHKTVYLAVDLGMGKTAIALKLIQLTKQKAFVFAPLRTIYSTWPDEIALWTPELTWSILHGPEKSLASALQADIILMNYEGLNWLSKQHGKFPRRMVIYDESSMVKSHSTQRFKLLRKMQSLWTDYKLCLSATPAPNGLHELWSQYYLLDKGRALGTNISTFRNTYCKSFSYPGMPIVIYTVYPRLEADIHKAVAPITFRLDAKDYLDMPPITYNRIKLKLTPALAKKYKELEKNYFLALDGLDMETAATLRKDLIVTRKTKEAKVSDAEVEVEACAEASSAALLSMTLRQFIQGGLYDEEKKWHEMHRIKLNALKELVETSAGQPILCAIQFRGELAMIREAFTSAPVIAGGTSVQQAMKYIKQWNAGTLPLLLCHPASLSHGVNLQSGGHILLWYGLTWSLEQYSQLNGRLYRQGQSHHVMIHHLVMQDTVDEAVIEALENKEAVQSSLLNYIKNYHEENK